MAEGLVVVAKAIGLGRENHIDPQANQKTDRREKARGGLGLNGTWPATFDREIAFS